MDETPWRVHSTCWEFDRALLVTGDGTRKARENRRTYYFGLSAPNPRLQRTPMQAQLVLDIRARIAEAPVWDMQRQRLLWTDHEQGLLYQARAQGTDQWALGPVQALGNPLAAALPCQDGRLIVAGGRVLYYLDPDGTRTPVAELPRGTASVFNEAKVDRQGRLWAGTRANDFQPGGGALYRLDGDGTLATVLEGVTVSNGMDWSPDGRTFYYIDSPTLAVDAFDFDSAAGALSRRRRLVTIEYGAGAPDGMTVDREGGLWVAIAGAGEVRRYAPDGSLLARVSISAPAVTSCCFGGDDYDQLFITCLGRRLPEVVLALGLTADVLERAATAPGAGGLFVCRPGVRGLASTTFAN
jgi:sugar lactone lactonase YvrE